MIVKHDGKDLVLNKDLYWSSDWNGYEVGYDSVPVVGLYQLKDTELHFYINMETLEVLEVWNPEEDED